MRLMRKVSARFSLALGCAIFLAGAAWAQGAAGSLEFVARITPTAARPEPVRQFTFYILTKSYAAIVREGEERGQPPAAGALSDGLTVSPELRAWLRGHDTLDLTAPEIDKLLTPDDLIKVPEFLEAYQRSNRGGVTRGLPRPKYREADRTEHPEKYEKLRQEYLNALMKFIRTHPETVSGVELELDAVNPQKKWAALLNERRRKVQRTAPDLAQIKFLAAKADTDLEGHGSVSGLAPGDYWISSLNLEAEAGDIRVHWDVPVTVEAGQTTRVELSNLNSTEANGSNP